MALTSLQVCMDSSDWLQGTIHEDTGMDSSSSPSGGDMLTCSRPLIERRLRPQHDQALKCPRCDSTHTKFCYYNNYSLSQPRYFCKTCRRYWTKGGTLRNIPVGGGCRKNKKVSTKKPSDNHHMIPTKPNPGSSTPSHSPTHLQLSFPEVQFSHLTNVLGNHGSGLISSHDPSPNFMDTKYNAFLENPRPIDFMKGKYDQENSRIIGHNFMGNADQLGMISNGFGDHMDHTFHGSNTPFSTPYGMSVDGNYSGTFMDACHRLMLPNYEGNEEHEVGGIHEVKPNTKLLALEWQQDQGCADQIAGKDHTFGYLNTGLGSWTGLINGYGSSATNPLV